MSPHHDHLTPPYDSRLNKPFMTPILEIQIESSLVKTFFFTYTPLPSPEYVDVKPGQFVMVWIPGCDEIPMSISHIRSKSVLGISVADVGEATHRLHRLKAGDYIGIRGPYGTSYQLNAGIAIIVGGGIGMASLLPLVAKIAKSKQDAVTDKKNVHQPIIERFSIINGAKNSQQLLFTSQLSAYTMDSCDIDVCTDDGSCGFKGFTTEKLEEILENELKTLHNPNKNLPITVYTCGPEIMLAKIFQICEKYKIMLQASLERMMRCGFGICGLCALDPTGWLVCRDGPVFNSEQLRQVTDFGHITREFSGKTRALHK